MAACVDLFVYGTLMSENRLYSLTKCHFARREAELAGFERFVPSTGYPYIIPQTKACVRGVLLFGVDSISLAVLDQYEEEGHLYYRHRVEVKVGDAYIPCEVYVGNVKALEARFGRGITDIHLGNS